MGGPILLATLRCFERMLFFYFRYVFLEGAHKSGQLSSPEYALMKQWFNFSVDKFRKQIIPDLIGIFDLNAYI